MQPLKLYSVGVALIITLGIFLAIVTIHPILLLCFFALLMAVLLNLPIRLLSRWVPRAIAMPVVLLFALGLVTGIGFLTVPVIVQQGREAIEKIPEAADRMERWYSRARQSEPIMKGTGGKEIQSGVKEHATEAVDSLVKNVFAVALGSVSAASGAILIFVLAALF